MSEIEESKDLFVNFDGKRSQASVLGSYIEFWNNIKGSRELIWQLFKRDYFATHRKSFLKYFWLIFSPLLGITSWMFMNYGGFLNPGKVGVPYPVYLLLGTSFWSLGVGLFQASQATLSSATNLVTQIRYPHEAILAKQVLIFFSNYSISFFANILIIVAMGTKIDIEHFLLFPIVVLPLVLFAIGVGLLLSMLVVVVQDLSNLSNVAIGLLIFFSPILYTESSADPRITALMRYNILTHLVCSPRDWILYGRLYDSGGFVYSAIFAVLIFLLSLRLFYLAENRLVEKMS